MRTLVLLRHGESIWNKENRFTGWTDVGLTEKGVNEAKEAGRAMSEAGYYFDLAFTSVLKRAIKTLWLALEEMGMMWIPVRCSWRLNERHYGDLQGANKLDMIEQFGSEQVNIWRRSYNTPPPPLVAADDRSPGNDPQYRSLAPEDLPLTESLKLTVDRVMPHWHDSIAPELSSGKRVLIVSHGNSLRALITSGRFSTPLRNVPTTNPICTAMTSHAIAPALSSQSALIAGVTADELNQSVRPSNSASARSVRLRH